MAIAETGKEVYDKYFGGVADQNDWLATMGGMFAFFISYMIYIEAFKDM